MGPDVAVFCHFEPNGGLRSDTLRYVTDLHSAGFTVVVVSNSGWLQPEALTALQAVCAAVLVRRNSGLDFSAWREAMQRLDLPRPGTRRLLLANDSVAGPLVALTPLLARMDGTADVWGMTDSEELAWHLQSYFLLAGEAVLHSAAWRRFWRRVRPMPSKLLVVMRYEVGLSRGLVKAGFRLRALFPCQSVGAGAGVNPTLAAWQALRQAGSPFVKRAVTEGGHLVQETATPASLNDNSVRP
jgi:lipopolysaccharide biosynthesis protein